MCAVGRAKRRWKKKEEEDVAIKMQRLRSRMRQTERQKENDRQTDRKRQKKGQRKREKRQRESKKTEKERKKGREKEKKDREKENGRKKRKQSDRKDRRKKYTDRRKKQRGRCEGTYLGVTSSLLANGIVALFGCNGTALPFLLLHKNRRRQEKSTSARLYNLSLGVSERKHTGMCTYTTHIQVERAGTVR